MFFGFVNYFADYTLFNNEKFIADVIKGYGNALVVVHDFRLAQRHAILRLDEAIEVALVL